VAETHEPSYYEIALTNRQVVVAFVILLTCLVAAFFSGVWIGREATARAAQEQIVRNTPPPQDAEGKNLEELEFFDPKAKKDHKDHKDHKKAASGEAAATSQDAVEKPVPGASPPAQASQTSQTPKRTTLADELAGRRTGTSAKPAQPAEMPAAAAPRPAAAPKHAAPAPAAADEEAEEAPVPAPRKAARAHDRTAAAGAGKGAYVIQVFSSADKAQADRIRAKLAGGGQKAFLSPIERGGRTMYRVRVGPFKSHDDAQKVADKVRKAYRLDTWVTE
jgi:cell division protein FtsN